MADQTPPSKPTRDWVSHRGGQKPKPLEVRLATGTPTTKRKAMAELARAVPRVEGEPQMPDWIGAEPETKAVWDRFAFLLKKRGQFTAEIEPAFIGLCVAYVQYLRVAKASVTEGARVANALAVADGRLRSWLNEFGLTDASRSKVTIERGSQEDIANPLARYGLN